MRVYDRGIRTTQHNGTVLVRFVFAYELLMSLRSTCQSHG